MYLYSIFDNYINKNKNENLSDFQWISYCSQKFENPWPKAWILFNIYVNTQVRLPMQFLK